MNTLIFKLTITFPLRQKNNGEVYNPTKTFYSPNPCYVTELQTRFQTKMMKSYHDINKVEMTTEYVSFENRHKNEKENGWLRIGHAKAVAEWVIFYDMLEYGDKSSTSELVTKVALRYSREVKVRIHKRDTVKRYWYTKFLGKRLPYSFYGRHSAYPLNDIKELKSWAKSFVDAEKQREAESKARYEKRKAERLASVS